MSLYGLILILRLILRSLRCCEKATSNHKKAQSLTRFSARVAIFFAPSVLHSSQVLSRNLGTIFAYHDCVINF